MTTPTHPSPRHARAVHPGLPTAGATAALLALAVLAGCAAPPPAPSAPPPPTMAPSPAPAPVAAPTPAPRAPVAAPVAPAAPSSLDTLETILNRVSGDSGVKIERTPTGALLLRATGDTAFTSGSSALSPRFVDFLQQLSNGLLTYGSLSAKVSGHTDSVGDATLNDRLSSARAQATVQRLTSLGVPANRLLAEGKGQREPIASNDSPEGRAANRRVDVLIIETGR